MFAKLKKCLKNFSNAMTTDGFVEVMPGLGLFVYRQLLEA